MLVLSGQITSFYSTYTLIYNTSFTDIRTSMRATTGDASSMPAVFWLLQSTVHFCGCNFTGNHISAIQGQASNITVSGNVTFSNNVAFAGTAFLLVHGSILNLTENSQVFFLNNHATNTGGVFCIANNVLQQGLTKCFLHIEGTRSQKRLTFVNNLAGEGGDILYGGEVALGLGGD